MTEPIKDFNYYFPSDLELQRKRKEKWGSLLTADILAHGIFKGKNSARAAAAPDSSEQTLNEGTASRAVVRVERLHASSPAGSKETPNQHTAHHHREP